MKTKLPFRTALAWSALSGFLALAWEIVWTRVFNFASASRAPAFGFMLAGYLLGLALGSLWSRRWQVLADEAAEPWPRIARVLLLAHLSAFAVAPLTAMLACHVAWQWGYFLVLISGGLLGIAFPLLCHASIHADDNAGSRLSWIYLANIVGSGAGSLLTGFVFMEWMGLRPLSLVLLALAWLWTESMALFRLPKGLRAVLVVVALASLVPFASLYERLQYKTEYNGTMRFPRIVESRHGVITVDSNKRVYGNGAYDGLIETGLEPGSWLVRPYALSAVRDHLENVLVIGVATGAWTQILADHPQVKHITAVELSHGYLELIASYPEVSGLLHNPKVEIVIDDGRRWLRRHPDARFDAIVMNTTHHWREFSSALLSKEFLTLVKSRLTPEGIAFWNCTDSGRAIRTGMEVFPHTLMIINNCVASNAPLQPDRERWARVLSQYQTEGRPLFDLTQESGRKAMDGVLDFFKHEGTPVEGDKWKWTNREHMQQKWGSEEVITDDNLGHEYR